jgi:hypothetical protein
MNAHDKSAIPIDATKVSVITRAQKASRRRWVAGDIFSKAHLEFFVKHLMAHDAVNAYYAYTIIRHLNCLFLEKNRSNRRAVPAHPFLIHM